MFLPEYKESIFVKEEDSLIKTETEGDNVNRLELEEENVSGIDLLSVADELRQSQEVVIDDLLKCGVLLKLSSFFLGIANG